MSVTEQAWRGAGGSFSPIPGSADRTNSGPSSGPEQGYLSPVLEN